jgi:hypothetical protein
VGVSSAAHFASAALNCALLVFSPLVSKIGPLPDVFGAGSFTPALPMQVANLANRRLVPPRPPSFPLFERFSELRARDALRKRRPAGCAKDAACARFTGLGRRAFGQRDAAFLQAFAKRREVARAAFAAGRTRRCGR